MSWENHPATATSEAGRAYRILAAARHFLPSADIQGKTRGRRVSTGLEPSRGPGRLVVWDPGESRFQRCRKWWESRVPCMCLGRGGRGRWRSYSGRSTATVTELGAVTEVGASMTTLSHSIPPKCISSRAPSQDVRGLIGFSQLHAAGASFRMRSRGTWLGNPLRSATGSQRLSSVHRRCLPAESSNRNTGIW